MPARRTLALALALSATALDNGLLRTPPMGFNVSLARMTSAARNPQC